MCISSQKMPQLLKQTSLKRVQMKQLNIFLYQETRDNIDFDSLQNVKE